MKSVFKPLALAAALAFVAAPAAAQETVRWGIPMAFGSNLTALGDTMPWVSEQLKKVSGGSINLQVFEPGKLGPALGIFDAVSSGKVEAGYSFMGYVDEVQAQRERLNDGIASQLRARRPLWQARGGQPGSRPGGGPRGRRR